ncbi:hypothetical protein CYMTET_43036 [Cymbomonas tetramitiformis]|uniref:Uncharacterized protein n=1 Tax=Cymbomonas tetramitiformis TaxID=36881 RepID=A0AAE0C2V2_9CHLO|nr:hypothetical protein CYMTET_43036 [Cymbomonas tetramitiformis]
MINQHILSSMLPCIRFEAMQEIESKTILPHPKPALSDRTVGDLAMAKRAADEEFLKLIGQVASTDGDDLPALIARVQYGNEPEREQAASMLIEMILASEEKHAQVINAGIIPAIASRVSKMVQTISPACTLDVAEIEGEPKAMLRLVQLVGLADGDSSDFSMSM